MLYRKNSLLLFFVLFSLVFGLLMFTAGCAQDTTPEAEPEEEPEEVPEETPEEVEIIDTIILATTTSTYDSGLLDFLNPIFTEQTGIEVQVVSQGTGAALETGARGDADVLLVHDRVSELRLVDEGAFVDRYDVMYNDFIFVGPDDDPAGIKAVSTAVEAFNLIEDSGNTFVSRGDDSGTNRMELRLWDSAGIDPTGESWYLSIGQGMGDTLNVANESLGYTLTDRGTYVAMKDTLDLVIVLEGDPVLFNQYGVMAVNPELHSHAKYEYAMMYIEFLMSDEGQNLINSYQVNGETLFFPGYGLE
ncbi:MAG: substrate-binding domain-containing protein [Bacillota bacterium]|nr:substrate-binding domain-containing protein [Bacillota bacterium]